MKTINLYYTTFLLLFALAAACNKTPGVVDNQIKSAEKSPDLTENEEETDETNKPTNEKLEKIEPVSVKELKDWLPDQMAKLNRKEAEGRVNQTEAAPSTVVNAAFASEDGAKMIRLTLTDYAAQGASLAESLDQKDDEGDDEQFHGKPTEINGAKGLETFDPQAKTGRISLLVAGRFYIEANASGLTSAECKNALAKLDYKKLKGWENYGKN